jgi:restriction system protein
MTFLTKGGLIEKTERATYGITDKGREFLDTYPQVIRLKDLEEMPGWKAAWKSTRENAKGTVPDVESGDSTTPLEALDDAVETLHSVVRDRLMKSILEQGPEFFEQLVLDVLLAMGYGGDRTDAAKHLGRSGDEGIDGRIDQDVLGLDQIMVQAKRYAPDRGIDRTAIQAFIGSLAGQGVMRGVFITTSYFKDSVEEFVRRGAATKVVLIDGKRLLELMMRYKIGVRVVREIELVDLDENYFADD